MLLKAWIVGRVLSLSGDMHRSDSDWKSLRKQEDRREAVVSNQDHEAKVRVQTQDAVMRNLVSASPTQGSIGISLRKCKAIECNSARLN